MNETKGSVHNFEIFKQGGIHFLDNILCVVDKGFQGIYNIHTFSVTPFKKPRDSKLTPIQKAFNRSLSS